FSGGNLADELRRFREELMFADLEILSNRIGKLEDNARKPRPAKEKEAEQAEDELLRRIVTAFEQGQPASALGLKEEEEKTIRSFQLLTLKPDLALITLGDDRIGPALPADLLQLSPSALQAPSKLELELDELANEDRQAFMNDLGLTGFSRGDI